VKFTRTATSRSSWSIVVEVGGGAASNVRESICLLHLQQLLPQIRSNPKPQQSLGLGCRRALGAWKCMATYKTVDEHWPAPSQSRQLWPPAWHRQEGLVKPRTRLGAFSG
jgi:hypothetical protein